MNKNTDICFVTALNDSSGALLEKAKSNWKALQCRFSQIVVHVTDCTHQSWLDFLESNDVPTMQSKQGWDFIGLHRRRSLKLGLSSSSTDRFFYADPDHMLRWVEHDPHDLDRVLKELYLWDCLVVGRSQVGFDAAPKRLKLTEAIVNHIYQLMTGRNWDLMMAARGLSRAAAQHLVQESKVDTLGNDVAWPLMLEKSGFQIGYAQSEGLRYETDDVYVQGREDSLDGDPKSWMVRVYAANQHVEAMKQFLDYDQ